ncbi:hypothetical protein QAD02_012788 [Eretmocerus hayati]|uniref:Uncharacterized protein n=1 Tax=Eretmocerus hayati TaxID=131215 RepID=A0ACC2P0Q5_9HYME|nr:hypothetical protein QAD02_012788 [Eretmocerus hayati]
MDGMIINGQVHEIDREDENGQKNPKLTDEELKEKMDIYEVVEWIVYHEFGKGNFEPGRETWEGGAKSLHAQFPLEDKPTRHYRKSYKSQTTNQPMGPSGIIHVIWKRLHEEAEQVGFAETTRRPNPFSGNDLSELELEYLHRLKTSTVIDEEYSRALEALRTYRLKLYKELSIDEIFETFPPLGTPDGYELFLIDFKFATGDISLASEVWTRICSAIFHLARQRAKESAARLELARYGYPKIDPSENKKSLDDKIEKLRAPYAANGFELTAYVVVIGKLDEIECSYLNIGSYTYAIPGGDSWLTCVDICSKCISALKKSSPRASTLVWSFFASEIYKTDARPMTDVLNSSEKLTSFSRARRKFKLRKRLP